MGNVICDAIRQSTGAHVGLSNGGSIRGNRVYPAGHVVTRRDILGELPFGNRTVLVEITGADLKKALENSVSQIDNRAGRFPQVSGMRIMVDAKAPIGARIKSVDIAGKPLKPKALYKVASNDFMLSGGDGFDALGKGRTLIGKTDGTLLANVVMAYVRGLKTIDSRIEGRIILK